jgi:hypothetical protein
MMHLSSAEEENMSTKGPEPNVPNANNAANNTTGTARRVLILRDVKKENKEVVRKLNANNIEVKNRTNLTERNQKMRQNSVNRKR